MPLPSPPERRGCLVAGAVKPYHSCWHFAMFAVVVFAALLALGLVACKGRLGGLKESRGGPLCRYHYFISLVFKKLSFILIVVLVFELFALPALNSPKRTRAKFSPAPENFAQEYLFSTEFLKNKKPL